MYLEEVSIEVSQGDVFVSLPLVSAADGSGQTLIQRVHVILLTQDCEYDKPSTVSVLVAAVLPLSGVASGSQGNVRKNRVASAFYLPPHPLLPESYVDIRAIGRVAKILIAAEANNAGRMLSLTEEARLALQRQIAGFFGYDR
ncbi:MAG: hypothetical protein ACRYFS_09695 [Janthinobacterium lividum]